MHAAADLLPAVREPTVADSELVSAIRAEGLPALRGCDGLVALIGLLGSASDPEKPEGPRWEITVSPGVIRVRTRDYAKADRSAERQHHRRRVEVDMAATFRATGEEVPDLLPTRGTIVAWSARSRARMVARLSDLDYTRLYGRYRVCGSCGAEFSELLEHCPACPGSHGSTLVDRTGRLPAMLTLTYPGDWLTVVPDAGTTKRQFWALAKRYERAWGEPLIGPWKLEFQHRGAPHFHLSTTPPMRFTVMTDPEAGELREVDFKTWLSITWADIVAHPDPEQRRRHRAAGTGVDYAEGIHLTDPRRMAVYFAKYGTAGGKHYQHSVPAEWLTSVLVCEDCGSEYDEQLDECPACGCLDAQLVDTGGGPGRFWGYRGLRPVLATRQVLPQVGITAGRTLRRWYHAKQLTTQVTVPRVRGGRPVSDQAEVIGLAGAYLVESRHVHYRRTRTRKRLFPHNRGFAAVAPPLPQTRAREVLTPRCQAPTVDAWRR